MKKWFFAFLVLASVRLCAQPAPFRFAFLSDTHIGSPDGKAEDDLRRTVAAINGMQGIAFVILTGDITELGTNDELKRAKQILDSLHIPWHIIPGNHDTGWSESGGTGFTTIFGNDKFSFTYNGIRFIGCASGPYVRMSDGHVPRSAINWLDKELSQLSPGQPLLFFNHYPIDNGLDNWYEITDRLHRVNTWAILCGHGHANKALDFEGIPGVMGRSNLRAKAPNGGFNIVEFRSDSLFFTEMRPGTDFSKTWTAVNVNRVPPGQPGSFARPSYLINDTFSNVREAWRYASPANIISTPVVHHNQVIVGNQDGEITALSLSTGKKNWTFKTGGAIFSSPAVSGNQVVIGSSDGTIYALDTRTGKPAWKARRQAAVLGSPLISGDTVFIGGSDHSFLALSAKSGKVLWTFDSLQGPVVSKPVISGDRILFGAWDRHLYALDRRTGKLIWKWNNGSTVRNYSPAACIPVISHDAVFVVAPDRYISCIDLQSGQTLWRNNDAAVRESIGISGDGNTIYGKTMQDTIVAYTASREKQTAKWKLHCGFGYEHVPSMLMEKNGQVFFGTRSGVVYSVDANGQKRNWAHKIDNSMVNTVNVVNEKQIVATTMDGKIVLLHVKN